MPYLVRFVTSSKDLNDDKKDIPEFPYELLPNELKVPILKNIHDPQDKLNILKALPSRLDTQRLMYWDYTSLQFELIYPLIYPYLKWPYDTDDCSWKYALNLCKVSPEFQKIVLGHLEKNIELTHIPEKAVFHDYQQEPMWMGDPLKEVRKAASDPTSPPWLTMLPFGVATCFTVGGQVKLLKTIGEKLWCLEMSLVSAYHQIPGIINRLVKCLHLAPNLRRLGLADLYPDQQIDENSPPFVLRGERLVLPELPQLKIITLLGDCSNCQRWILPKYTRQLEVLHLFECYLTENFNSACFPKLETIHVKSSQTDRMEYRNANIDKVNDLLNKFLLSPLKEITVVLEDVDVPKFFTFMLTLNNFGETLDILEMKFGTMNGNVGGVEVKNELRGWISQLKFPKLSCLHLENYVGPLEFLLKMPGLKILNIVTSNLEPLQRSNVKGLNFSTKKKVMLESAVWKLLPVLEWFQMVIAVYQKKGIWGEQPCYLQIPCQKHIYITRNCYEKHQSNEERLNRL